jgi:hypothetical protein
MALVVEAFIKQAAAWHGHDFDARYVAWLKTDTHLRANVPGSVLWRLFVFRNRALIHIWPTASHPGYFARFNVVSHCPL